MEEKNRIRGKKALASGRRFEAKTRKDLENKKWIVSRWGNNVEFEENPNFFKLTEGKELKKQLKDTCKKCKTFPCICGKPRIIGKLIPAKQGKFRKTSTGFPDFICIKFVKEEREVLSAKGTFYPTIKEKESVSRIKSLYEVIGVEAKSKGYLDKEEKEKAEWYLKNKVFSKFLVAYKDKNKRGGILYKEIK